MAAQNPEKLKELVDLFDSEARRNHVYPLEPKREGQPLITSDRTSFVYYGGMRRIAAASAPRLAGRRHVISADLEIPAAGASGVVIAQGGRYGGFTLYVKDNHLTYETNANGHSTGKLASTLSLPPGKVHVTLEFVPDETGSAPPTGPAPVFSGTATLSIDGKPAGTGHISALGFGGEGLDIGSDLGSPVTPSYEGPFAFSGTVDTVTVEPEISNLRQRTGEVSAMTQLVTHSNYRSPPLWTYSIARWHRKPITRCSASAGLYRADAIADELGYLA